MLYLESQVEMSETNYNADMVENLIGNEFELPIEPTRARVCFDIPKKPNESVITNDTTNASSTKDSIALEHSSATTTTYVSASSSFQCVLTKKANITNELITDDERDPNLSY